MYRELVLAIGVGSAALASLQATAAGTGGYPYPINGLPTITEKEYMSAVHESFYVNTPQEWQRFHSKTLQICNATHDHPDAQQVKEIVDRERKTIVYPKDGKLMGDWKKGQHWAEMTSGGRIGYPGFADADDPSKPSGSNCYACHAIDPSFPQHGNIGPSLVHYGKVRGSSPALIKYVYDKIYDSKAFNPCSLMPRFGGAKHLLTPEQVADLTAYLMDPKSPVNVDPIPPAPTKK